MCDSSLVRPTSEARTPRVRSAVTNGRDCMSPHQVMVHGRVDLWMCLSKLLPTCQVLKA